jgi:hypothetical protein
MLGTGLVRLKLLAEKIDIQRRETLPRPTEKGSLAV